MGNGEEEKGAQFCADKDKDKDKDKYKYKYKDKDKDNLYVEATT